MTIDPSKPQLSTRGCLLHIGVALFAVVAVLGLAAAGYFFVDQQKHHKALAAEIQAIRNAGEPLDGAALNEFYRVREGETDITAEWVAALEPFSSDGPLEKSAEDLERLLNLKPREQRPHRPQTWAQQAEAEQLLSRYRAALDRVVIASSTNGSVRYPLDFTTGRTTNLPHLGSVRRAAIALYLQTLVHYHRGEMNQAADHVIALIQMSESLKREPLLISQEKRASYLRSAESLIVFLAADRQFPEEELSRIQGALSPIEFETIRLPIFLGERAVGYQSFSQP